MEEAMSVNGPRVRVMARWGADCQLRYIQDNILTDPTDTIVFGEPLYAITVCFKPGGYARYLADMIQLQRRLAEED
jgi:hypothetical protein